MLKINIICVGDFKEKYLKEAEQEYLKRLTRFYDVKTKILKEDGIIKESQSILKEIDGYSILMDIQGKQVSSHDLADKIANLSQTNSKLTFIIGGSDGVLDCVREKVSERISFGKITLPHQLARIVLLEQIYRSGTINFGIKYHK